MEEYRKRRLRGSHAIFEAVLEGDILVIDDLIKSNQTVLLEKTRELWTPLHVAVLLSNERCVSHLLLNGADPLSKDVDGMCPLHWAAFSNIPFSIFKILATAQDDSLHVFDMYGRTPLHYVCMRRTTCEKTQPKDLDKYELILKLNFLLTSMMSNIEFQDYEGNTPVLLLSSNIHNFITDEVDHNYLPADLKTLKSKSICGFTLEMFMNKNVNFQARNTYGKSALHFACQNHCVEMVRILVYKATETHIPVDESGNSPVALCFKPSMCYSLQYKAKLSSWLPHGNKKRFEDSLRPIIKRWRPCLDIQQLSSGFSALHNAIMDMGCSIKVVKAFLEYCTVNTNIRDHLGKTPLHYGIRTMLLGYQSIDMENVIENWRSKITYLIQKRADVNAQDLGGNTPLHDACLSGDLDFVRILLDNNADPTIRNKSGATPLHLLSTTKIQILVFYNQDTISSIIDSILEKSPDLNCQDIYGSTALHYAIYNEDKEVVLKLISRGANRKIKDVNGQDSVLYCKLLGHTSILKHLTEEVGDATKQADDIKGFLMTPIAITQVYDWLQSDSAKKKLPDSKIIDLLSSSDTSRLSNSPGENIVLGQLLQLMRGVFDEVERIDPRFKVTLELAGSTREGTKVKDPDEFDLLCFLDNFNHVCEIEESDSDFVFCQVKPSHTNEYKNLCNTDNMLSAHKLTTMFYFCIRKALSDLAVWQLATGFTLDSTSNDFKSEEDIYSIQCLHFRYSDAVYKNLEISCDIVPVIRKTNWWPSFARQSGRLISLEVKANGCMVIVKPQRQNTLSGERVRLLTRFGVSVYLSEYNVLLSVPNYIRQAYKLAKILLKEKNIYPPLTEENETGGKY